jgi:hypothetical protein
MFALTIEVAAAATAIVARLREEVGIAGALGEPEAVPATTCRITSLDAPAYAVSRTVKHTRSILARVALAAVTVSVTAASLYV